jgi:hypothetical protein
VLWLVVVLTVLLVVSRAAFVVPLSLLHNCWSATAERLGRREVVTVWWAGLMRGAVSIALVYQFFDDESKAMLDRHRATLIVATLTVRGHHDGRCAAQPRPGWHAHMCTLARCTHPAGGDAVDPGLWCAHQAAAGGTVQ